MTSCDACAFVYNLDEAEAAGAAIERGAVEAGTLLTDRNIETRERRSSEVWSPLEYGCHLRDMLLVQRERVLAARRDNGATTPMGRDERVMHDGYADQDPQDVARQLRDAAQLFANVLSRLDDEDWGRTVEYNYPSPAKRSLRWVAIHTLHEVRHHLADIKGQLV